MSTKTYAQLGAQTGVQDADLLATWRSVGPLKTNTWAELKADAQTDVPGDQTTFQQAGTGAGLQTMQEKARQIISVEDYYNGTSDDFTAIQRCFDYANTLGGCEIRGTKQLYTLTDTPVLNLNGLTTPMDVRFASMFKNSAGVNGGALRIHGSSTALPSRVRGVMVDHRLHTTTERGIACDGTAHLTLEDCGVWLPNSTSGYTGLHMYQTDPNNDGTACFWTETPGLSIRSNSGIIANTVAVWLDGAMNATKIRGAITGAVDGVKLTGPTGWSGTAADMPSANSVLVDAWIEGATNAVHADLPTGAYAPYGLCIGGRLESISGFALLIDGSGGGPSHNSNVPPIILPQCVMLQSVGDIYSAPAGIIVNVLQPYDWVLRAQTGMTVWPWNNATSALRIVNAGNFTLPMLELCYPDAPTLPVVSLGFAENHVGELTANNNLAGDWHVALSAVAGLSGTHTRAKNLNGQATFTSAATKAVSLPKTESDASYKIGLGWNVNETIWVTNKTTTGFTLNSSNATSTAVVDWLLHR